VEDPSLMFSSFSCNTSPEINLPVTQQDQIPRLLLALCLKHKAAGWMSEAQSFWVDPRCSRIPLRSSSLESLLLGLGHWDVSQAPHQLGSKPSAMFPLPRDSHTEGGWIPAP